MKKIAFILALVLVVGCFAACGKSDVKGTDTEPSSEEIIGGGVEGGVVGGWTFQDITTPIEIPEDAKAALDKALEGFGGSSIEPIALLETQVVAGSNLAFLAKVTPVVPNAVGHYAIVYVYKDLQGGAEITNIADLIPGDLAEMAVEFKEDVVGGWTMAEFDIPVGNDMASRALGKATEGLSGANFEPIGCMATQVVAGTNYCIFCRQTLMSASMNQKYVLAYVYEDLQGECSAKFADIDVAELSKKAE